jgi:hypothetical protein
MEDVLDLYAEEPNPKRRCAAKQRHELAAFHPHPPAAPPFKGGLNHSTIATQLRAARRVYRLKKQEHINESVSRATSPDGDGSRQRERRDHKADRPKPLHPIVIEGIGPIPLIGKGYE